MRFISSGVHAVGLHSVLLSVEHVPLEHFKLAMSIWSTCFCLELSDMFVMLLLCFSDYLHFSIAGSIASAYG